MFKNAGTQLKTLARICAGLTIVIGIILGITVSKTADSIKPSAVLPLHLLDA